METETPWWNIIRDTPFDIGEVKAKRRYEIKKGIENFQCEICDAKANEEELFKVYMASSSGFPNDLKKQFNRKNFEESINKVNNKIVFVAKKMGTIYGYAVFGKRGKYISFNSLRVDPEEEHNNINFAIIYYALTYFADDLASGCYIDDGVRATYHSSSHFQDYLQKYFGFHKAYSILHIHYRWFVKPIIMIIFPFRRFLSNSQNGSVKLVYSLLKQEEISRECIALGANNGKI